MSYWLIGAQLGSTALGAYSKWSATKEQAKVDKLEAKLSNRVVALQGAQARNTLNVNRSFVRQDIAVANELMETREIQSRGAALVQSGTTGQQGGSVLQVLTDTRRNRERAANNVLRDVQRRELQFAKTDRDISIRMATSKLGVYNSSTSPISLLSNGLAAGLLTASTGLSRVGR